jgi:hypothetical protein
MKVGVVMLSRAGFALAVLAAAVVVVPVLAQEKKPADAPADEDPTDLGSLEALALKVETDALCEGARLRDDLSVAFLKDLPRPQGLAFPVANSIKSEIAFTQKYYELYAGTFDAAAKRARDVAKENDVYKDAVKGDDGVLFMKAFLKKFPAPRNPKTKKDAAANEVRALLVRMFERYEKLRANQTAWKDPKALEKEIASREANAKEFQKKYDFGAAVAKQHLDGASKLYFDLSKATYDLVKQNLGVLNAKALTPWEARSSSTASRSWGRSRASSRSATARATSTSSWARTSTS